MIKENPWQTVYEQLQEILNKCIELWWKPWWNSERLFKAVWCVDEKYMIHNWDPYSYHELFSKDSGIMERIEWKMPIIEYELPNQTTWFILWHYMLMSDMTAEMKCNYFVNNAIIPTK